MPLHPAPADKIRGRLRVGFASHAKVKRSRWISFDTFENIDFEIACAEALKHCGKWIDESDFEEICYSALRKVVPTGTEEDSEDRDVTAMEAEQAAQEVIDLLNSLPRRYAVWIPLPGADTPADEIPLTRSIKLIRVPARTNSGLRASLAPKLEGPYLVVESAGYGKSSLGQSAVHEALAIAKRIVAAALVQSVFGSVPAWRRYGLIGSAMREPQPAHVHLRDLDGDGYTESISLPNGMARLLQSLVVVTEKNSREVLFGLAQPRVRSAYLQVDLSTALVPLAQVLSEPSAIENSAELRSALEWTFDAYADDDTVGTFIKTCIALEAILGEGSDDEGITKRLSDRCAYLLDRTVAGRRKVRQAMRDIYELRSSIVHGKKTRLDRDDERRTYAAAVYRDSVLRVELEALQAWWGKSRRADGIPEDAGRPRAAG